MGSFCNYCGTGLGEGGDPPAMCLDCAQAVPERLLNVLESVKDLKAELEDAQESLRFAAPEVQHVYAVYALSVEARLNLAKELAHVVLEEVMNA